MSKEFYDKSTQSLTDLYEVTYDYDEDEDGETVEQVVVDGKKYIDIEYFARIKADLEAKLAESETLIQRLQSVIDNLRNKSFAGSTLVDAITNVYEPIYKVKFDECEQLKQQLAEKERIIEAQYNGLGYWKSVAQKRPDIDYIFKINDLEQQLAEKDLKIIELETKLNLKDKETDV